ncbi:MAG: hypothetical protein MUC49_13450 [Raineya sp.]|jgi:hypothetical protein|nr:hypothetical protein [Raineya sp.]
MEKFASKPEDFEVTETNQGIAIHNSWYKPQMVYPLMIFNILWFMLIFYMFRKVDSTIFQAFLSIFFIAGLVLVWYIVCLFFNKTDIAITSQDFISKHAPIPFPTYKNIHLKRSDIEQVYITGEYTRNKHNSKILNGYALNVLSPEGISSRILSYGIEEYEKVVFLKKKIEQYMNIDPQPVEGEYIQTLS